MALTIKGSVKRGSTPLAADVKLWIKETEEDKASKWESAVSTSPDDGEFYIEISDGTGQRRDFNRNILYGEVVKNTRILPLNTIIKGTEAELHFREPATVWKELLQHVVDAARLRSEFYARIVDTPNALWQALLVAVAGSLAFASVLVTGGADAGVGEALAMTLVILVVLAVAFGVMYVVGTTVLAVETTSTTVSKFLRPLGFATAPLLVAAITLALLRAFGASGGFLNLLFVVALVWEVLALTVAVRQVLNYGKQWGRAIGVVLIPFVLMVGVLWLWLMSTS